MASQPPGRWPAETRAIRRVGAPLCRDVLASRGGKITLRRPRVRLHPDPGHCDCRDRAGGGPVPIQPLPGGTQFARTMPELGRQHRYMGAAPNPRTLTGRFGASSHVLRFPCGLSSGFPFAHPGSSPSFAVPWLPLVRRPPVRSLRPSLSGSVPLRVPFPLSNLYVSAAARRFCRRWSRAAGTKVTSSRRDPWPGSRRIRPQRRCSPGADRVARRGQPHHCLHLGSRDDPGSWRPGPRSFQRRARPGP
jgi:hypothetical protein